MQILREFTAEFAKACEGPTPARGASHKYFNIKAYLAQSFCASLMPRRRIFMRREYYFSRKERLKSGMLLRATNAASRERMASFGIYIRLCDTTAENSPA